MGWKEAAVNHVPLVDFTINETIETDEMIAVFWKRWVSS
jgi:hypothetical protein